MHFNSVNYLINTVFTLFFRVLSKYYLWYRVLWFVFNLIFSLKKIQSLHLKSLQSGGKKLCTSFYWAEHRKSSSIWSVFRHPSYFMISTSYFHLILLFKTLSLSSDTSVSTPKILELRCMQTMARMDVELLQWNCNIE